jgi:hypothetical protein
MHNIRTFDDEPTVQSFSTPLSFADLLDSLGLDEVSGHMILDQLFQKSGDHGFFGMLNDLQLNADIVMRTFQADEAPPCPPELGFALLAIGLEVYSSSLSSDLQQNKNMIVDTLRIEFLKRIPPLTWKSTDLNFYQGVALSLASFTWCLDRQLADVAGQWNGIARVLLHSLIKARKVHPQLSSQYVFPYLCFANESY